MRCVNHAVELHAQLRTHAPSASTISCLAPCAAQRSCGQPLHQVTVIFIATLCHSVVATEYVLPVCCMLPVRLPCTPNLSLRREPRTDPSRFQVLHVGACDAATYPMAKKKQSLEFLREKAHLRPRWGGVWAGVRGRGMMGAGT